MRPVQREHVDAVIEALEGFGLRVGDHEAPGGEPPYVVVYAIPGGASYGTLADHAEDLEMIVQVTCVGVNRQQAQWLADKANGLLDGLAVPDRYIPLVTLDVPGGVSRDDGQTRPVFIATPRYRIFSTAA